MKQISILLLLIPLVVFSTTYNTIDLNGTRPGSKTNDWDPDEDFTDISSADNAYFTWDETYLYFAIDDAEAAYGNLATFMYFDTDPDGSNGTTSGYTWGEYITTPFSSDFVVVWKNNTSDDYIEFRTWSGSAWTQTSSVSSTALNTDEVAFSIGTNYREVRIKRSILGVSTATDKISFCTFSEQQWSSYYRYFAFPSEGWTDANRASSQAITHYRGYTLGSGYSPDDVGGYDQSLPVELSSFQAQNTRSGVTLTWSTDSEIENQGFILSRKTADTRWAEIASFQTDRSLLGQGSTSQATRYRFTDSKVREGVSYSYLLSDVDYRGNRTDHLRQVAEITHLRGDEGNRPDLLSLTRLYPNPFNPSTTLTYSLEESAHVQVNIYDIHGQLIWNRSIPNQPASDSHQITWTGVDALGMAVNSGIYLIRIQAGEQSFSKKVTLLR